MSSTNDSGTNDVEVNVLNEFYSYLKCQDATNNTDKLDNTTLNHNLKIVLNSAIHDDNKKKSELAVAILDHLYTNEYIIDNEDKLSGYVAANIDKTFFDKLLKLFLSTDHLELTALKLVKILISVLRSSLHQNLSIVNPLLQIMELGFKHSNNEVKQDAYQCWAHLIRNFALEKAFFFKSKKFNLILTPLINKCKAYKNEELCRSKACAWLCLIENVNERLPEYMTRAVLPFMSYCFGIVDKTIEYADTTAAQKAPKTTEFNGVDHTFESLYQIGFEFLVSLVHNGDMGQLEPELRNKLQYVNHDRYYMVKHSLTSTATWQFMLKYFFEVILKKASFLDTGLILQTWQKLFELLRLLPSATKDTRPIFADEVHAEDEEHAQSHYYDLSKMFLKSTLDYVVNFQAKQALDSKFYSQVVRLFFIALRTSENSCRHLFENEKFTKDVLSMFKKSGNLILVSEEEDTNYFLSNLNNMLVLMDAQPSLVDLYNWLHLSARFYDHLRCLKARTGEIILTENNYETVKMLLIFPFKYFKKLDIQESDIKIVINSLSNAAKTFNALIKQDRIKLEEVRTQGGSLPREDFTVNTWCIELFKSLRTEFSKLRINELSLESQVKILFMEVQFNLYLLQNVFDYELVNQITENQANVPIFQVENAAKNSSYLDMYFKDLVGSINELTHYLHKVVANTENNGNANEILVKNKDITPALVENKQPIQIFCNLIDLVSILFTRIKSHTILSQFLISFALPIELISELNSLSKLTSNAEASPAAKKASRLSQMNHPYHTVVSTHINFQSTRHSNDLYDKLSMQIASYIQTHLTKTFSYHQFDSSLLKNLEPIFFSFLKYSQKVNLKQKTLQAWNSTFGKSTIGSLSYSPRLEELFVEIRDEMQNNKNTNSTTPQKSNYGLIALSLPGLKLIESQQGTNMTSSFMNDDYLMGDEKENTPDNSNGDQNKKAPTDVKKLIGSKSKDFLNEASCSSVPVATLVTSTIANANNKASPSFGAQLKTTPVLETNKKPENSLSMSAPRNKKLNNDLLKEVQKNNSHSVTANFCFSDASGISSSTSKLGSNLMRTPDASCTGVRSSPRSLRNNNSKRKLDLNVLIDQMPDKDFIEITSVKANKIEEEELTKVMNKLDRSAEKKKPFKQPLTEHQKEVRRKKSFIPMEIQSVCCVLEPTMDSQMSCTNDETLDSGVVQQQQQQVQMAVASNNLKSDMNETNSTVQASNMSSSTEKVPLIESDVIPEESKNQMDVDKSVTEPPTEVPTRNSKDDDEDYLIANMSTNDILAVPTTTTDIKPTTPHESDSKTMSTNSFDIPSVSSSSNSPSKFGTINFKSKIKPDKKIELVEVRSTCEVVAKTDDVKVIETDELLEKEKVATAVVVDDVFEEVPKSTDKTEKIVKNEEIEKQPQTELEVSTNRRRSSRLSVIKAKETKPIETEAPEPISKTSVTTNKLKLENEEQKLEMVSQVTRDVMNENMTDMVDMLTHTISQSPVNEEPVAVDENEVLNQLNEECKVNKMNLKSLRNKYKRMGRKNNDLMGIDHKLAKSRVCKSSFKMQQEKLKLVKSKQKRYNQLIQGLKYNKKVRVNKQKAELVNELNKSLNEDKLKTEFKENLEEPQKVEVKPDTMDIKETDVYAFEDVEPESASSEDDDELPISSLVKNKTVEDEVMLDQTIELQEENLTEVKPVEIKVTALGKTKLDDIAEDNLLSTPIAKMNTSSSILAKSLNTSPSTAALIHKSNGTPTTSILKKRLIESKIHHSATKKMVNISSAALFEDCTPTNKRRVSFCESVQIEEIEPNFNKSLFRSTPKPQNRAKLVLSSYFNNKQPSSPSSLNTQATLNAMKQMPPSNTISVTSNNQTYEAKLNCSLNSATSNMSPKNSIASKYKMNPNSRLSVCETSLPSNNIVSNSNNSPSLTTPMSPGSSSLINFFSNNKQGFLSQRSAAIQQQMVQNQNQRTIPQNRHSLSNTSSPIASTVTASRISKPEAIPSVAIESSKVESVIEIKPVEPVKTTPASLAENVVAGLEVYPKLKDCMIPIEKIGIEPTFLRPLVLSTWLKTLKAKEILTVGDLCSLNAEEIGTLPFKLPKLESFMSFIKKFEELNETESAHGSTKQLKKLGSVEEEMDKLEHSSHELDTSIESETVNEPKPANNTSGMDVDMDASPTTKVNTNVKKPTGLDQAMTNLKSYVSNENTTFNLDSELDMRQVMKLLEHADNVESEILVDLQVKLCRLSETRKKLRSHAEALIDSKE